MPIEHFHVAVEFDGDLYEFLSKALETGTVIPMTLSSLEGVMSYQVSLEPYGINRGQHGLEFVGKTATGDTDGTVPPGTTVIIEFPLGIARANIL